MKKRFSWAILALVLIFTSVGPTFAAESNPDAGEKLVFLSDEEAAMVLSGDSIMDEGMALDEDSPAPFAYPSVSGNVYSMTISPIMYVIVDGQAGLAQLDSISLTYQFKTLYQNALVKLSNSEAKNLIGRLAAVCEEQAEDYTFIGWLLKVTFVFEAPTPKSFEWMGYGTNIEPSDRYTLSLTGHGTKVYGTCSYPFASPEGIDIMTERYDIEIGGMYYFKTVDGTSLSMKVSGTCAINA